MMHGTYADLAGILQDCDLDSLQVLASGTSGIKKGWTGLLAYLPERHALIELRSSVPDIRGYSRDEASQVDRNYAIENYGLAPDLFAKY